MGDEWPPPPNWRLLKPPILGPLEALKASNGPQKLPMVLLEVGKNAVDV